MRFHEGPLRLRCLRFFAGCGLWCLAAVYAQNSASSSQGDVPVLKVNARAVVVDVVVTKGNDEPVSGLHKQNFEVMEDGRPQAVDFFEEHSGQSGPAVSLPPMPPHVFTNVPVAPPSDSVNVLLLDSLNTPMQDQSFVHQQIMGYLKSMQPGTRIAIFTLSSKLRYVQGFTADSAALLAALDNKKKGVPPETTPMSRTHQDDVDDKEHIKTMEMMLGGTDAGVEAIAQFQADFATYQTDQRVSMTLEALQHLARYLSGVPGRKNLIWFSSLFPIAIFPNAREVQSLKQTREYSKAVRETADLLTLAKVAVYPVGAQGMMNDHLTDASNFSRDLSPANEDADSRAANIAAMEQLAADTGGEAIFNTNDLNKAMARDIRNGSHYYTLSYTPANKKMDGKYRRIEVKVTEGKYKLAYRRGYYADDTIAADAKPESDRLRSLLAHGLPSASQVLYGVRVVPAVPQPATNAARAGANTKLTGPVTRYSVDFLIHWKDVELEPAPEGTHRGKIEVGLIAYDHDGHAVNWAGSTQTMNLDASTFAAIQRSGVPAHMEIDLPQRDVYLATGVYDWGSKRAGTLEVSLSGVIAPVASTSQEAQQRK